MAQYAEEPASEEMNRKYYPHLACFATKNQNSKIKAATAYTDHTESITAGFRVIGEIRGCFSAADRKPFAQLTRSWPT
jgi:hypothetical protein